MMRKSKAIPVLLGMLCLHYEHAVAKSNTKILFLGDSLTQGYGVAQESSFPNLIAKRLAKEKHSHVEIINAGISGSTTASGIARLRWHLRGEPKPKILVLALGANDGLRGQKVENSRQNLKRIIAMAKSHNMKILLAGMKMPPNYGKSYTEKYEKMFVNLAQQESIHLIPFLLDKVAGEKHLNIADGIHPNEEGHKIIAETVLKYLRPLLP